MNEGNKEVSRLFERRRPKTEKKSEKSNQVLNHQIELYFNCTPSIGYHFASILRFSSSKNEKITTMKEQYHDDDHHDAGHDVDSA